MIWRTVLAAAVAAAVSIPVAAQTVIRVPVDTPNLDSALGQVSNGGVIELAAGSYQSPSGGFVISNPNMSFTIRAAAGATVTLSGGGSTLVLRIINSSVDHQSNISFQDLIFANGRSAHDGAAGGVTLEKASATFERCTFRDNNSAAPTTGGGGTAVFIDSVAHFVDCVWRDNVATNEGAGLRVGEGSAAYVHRGRFINNRTNLSFHRPSATGGGIHVTDSVLWLSNSRLEGNQAGYAGGGLYVLGTWQQPYTVPRAEAVVVNCTFEDNESKSHSTVSFVPPTEGGAVNIEDQARVTILNSRFVTNSSELGGCMSVYRADVAIADSVFMGNRAVGVGSQNGFGGTFKISASDLLSDQVNFPTADVTLVDSYVQCAYPTPGPVAQVAGGLFAAGDICRKYGAGGCQLMGSTADNRSHVTIDNVIFADCDVDQGGVPSQGLAGGVSVSLTDLDLTDSLVIAGDATGTTGSAGALRVVFESDAQVDRTTFAGNSAPLYGGAIYAAGTTVNINDCQIFDNEVSPGESEPEVSSFGAAIFSAPVENAFGDSNRDLPVTGTLSNSMVSRNTGMPLFEDDRNPQPINAVRYLDNDFYNTTFGSRVYRHGTAQSHTPSGLNSLVITHSGVDKGAGNSWLSSEPELGALLAVPTRILMQTAVGDPESTTSAYLGYAWHGGNATLDGVPQGGGFGWGPTTVGTHNLWVQGNQFQATVGVGPTPAVNFTASPAETTPGQPVTLSWSLVSGTFVGVEIDHGLNPSSVPSGQLVVTPSVTTTYSMHMVTQEGGVTATATVCVNCESPLFSDGFESGDTTIWSTAVSN